MTEWYFSSNQPGREANSAFSSEARPNRRVKGQRRLCPDRRKANIQVENCRRKQAQDRRTQQDRRPEYNNDTEILRTVPVKKRFIAANTSGPVIGSIINISV